MNKIVMCFLLIATNIYAQPSYVKVNYGLKIGFDEGFSKADALKDIYAQAQEGAKMIHFELEANKNASYFKMKELMPTSAVNFATSFSEAYTSYYTEANSIQKVRHENSFLGEFRIHYEEKTEWKLEKESKYIDTFLCYKATSEQVVVNSEGTFRHPIIAWYSPTLPFSFGPKGYTGLPGLILELQIRNISYGASKIELSADDKIIKKPVKGKLVSLEEYTKMLSAPPSFNE